MRKKLTLCMYLLIGLLQCGCSREHMTAEFSEKESCNPDDIDVEEKGQLHDIEVSEEVSAHEYRSNPFGVMEEDKERTRFGVYFLYGEEKEKVQEKWNTICELDDVEQAQMVTNCEGTISINCSDINPEYFKYCISLNSECEQIYKKYGMPVRTHVYAVDGIDKTALCMYRRVEASQYEGWDREEWTFYAEENSEFQIEYIDKLGDVQNHSIVIEEILDIPPWYLDYEWTNTECIILMPEDKYAGIFGEDISGKNIRGLFGSESFYIKSREGKREKLEKEVERTGIDCTSNRGYLKEE